MMHRRRKALSNRRDIVRRARVVEAWRRQYGDLCPGWLRDAHESTDLCADHPLEVHLGGDEHQALVVLCRSCNSRKSNAVRRRARKVAALAATAGSREW